MAGAIGIGLIGTGGVATLHANAINAVSGIEAAEKAIGGAATPIAYD